MGLLHDSRQPTTWWWIPPLPHANWQPVSLAGPRWLALNKDGKAKRGKHFWKKRKNSANPTGLVSDTRITHADPGWVLRPPEAIRSLENEIAVESANNNVDVIVVSGLR